MLDVEGDPAVFKYPNIVPIGPSGTIRGLGRHAGSPRNEPIIRVTPFAVSNIYQNLL
jgi:hypothetical protein